MVPKVTGEVNHDGDQEHEILSHIDSNPQKQKQSAKAER